MLAWCELCGLQNMLTGAVHTNAASGKRLTPRRLSKGMSLIELLLGVAIGLFILAGANTVFITNMTNSRRLLLEARINQDLRSSMDLISRDLRRGAYWGNSLAGTLAAGSVSSTLANPYSAVAVTGSTQIDYTYTQDATENNALDAATEQFGFRLNMTTHAVEMNIGGIWKPLTNTDVLMIPNNGFTITPTETVIDIRTACAKTCTDSVAMPTCPRVQVRTYNIVLQGVSITDSAVSRTLHSQVRVRNDALSGSCPA